MMINKRRETILTTLVLAVIVIVVNLLGDRFSASLDLTEDKRWSLTTSTYEVLDQVETPIYIRVLLSGDFPAGFERLEEATKNLLEQYQAINTNIEFSFEDPTEGSVSEVNSRLEYLKSIGILGTNLIIQDQGKMSERYIFPYAIINYGQRSGTINLLKAQERGESEDVTLNTSINLLEYKFSDQINKMVKQKRPVIALLTGNGELEDYQTAALETSLGKYYELSRINIDSVYQLPSEVNLLIVAGPITPFDDRDKLILDQYIMQGGKVLWAVEKYDASVFGIDKEDNYVPLELTHNLDDLFFSYGVRYKPNLLLDLQCSQIAQVVAVQGGKPQTEMFPWFYDPIVNGSDIHPIVNNISSINLTFPSEIETLKNKGEVVSVDLLTTSPNSRYQVYPMRLSFDVVRLGEDPSKFDKGRLPLAVFSEGEFVSHFANRLSGDQQSMLDNLGMTFLEKSKPTKQLWISDVDIMSNLYNPQSQRISPMGFNQWEKKTYEGNAEFMLNAIDYMIDDINVMEARNKNVKLRLLNRAKVIEEKTKWQLINMLLPLVVLGIFGMLFYWIRKKKYAFR